MIHEEKTTSASINLWEALAAHKRPMTWTFSMVMLLVLAMTFLGTKIYSSEGKLFVRLGRESVGMDPTTTAATGQVVMVHESREYEINSVFELFKSRAVLANVVSGMTPQVVLGRDQEAQPQSAGMFSFLGTMNTYSIDDEAIKHLSDHLSIIAVKKSNIINVSYEATSPQLAHDIVNSVIEQARDAHIRVNRTAGSHDFFVTQTEQLREKLTRLESELRDRKNADGVTSLLDQRVILLQQVAELESSLRKTESALSASNAEIASQEAMLKDIPEMVSAGEMSNMPHSALSAMREQLFTAEVHEKELLSRCTKDHPLAIAAAEQIASLKAVIAQEPVKPQTSLGPNRTHQEMSLAHLKGENNVASLKANAETIRAQLIPARERLTTMNNNEAELARLDREIAIETANYKKYAESLEQSRIDQELVMNNISNLNVLQPPTVSLTPIRPRRTLNLGLGFLAAVASSLCVGLLLEHRKSGILYRLGRPASATTPAIGSPAAEGTTTAWAEKLGLDHPREGLAGEGATGTGTPC